MAKRIFITGGSGLIGRSILDRLADNFSIRAMRRASTLIHDTPEEVEWIEGDILDVLFLEEEIKAADVVIHCAAAVSFQPTQRKQILKLNVDVTKDIADLCLTHGKRLIHFSSVAALGKPSEGVVIDEKCDYILGELNTDYALSKHLGEVEVWRAIAEGLDAVILNPTIVLGIPSKWTNSTGSFWVSSDKGSPFYTTGLVGFVDARDIAAVVEGLVDSEVSGERFIMNGVNTSYKDFQDKVAQSLGKKGPRIKLGNLLGGLIWRIAWLLRPFGDKIPYTKAIHRIAAMQNTFSNAKAVRELGASFRPLDESIQWVTDQYKKK